MVETSFPERTEHGLHPLPFEPLAVFRTGAQMKDAAPADCRGARIGILIVAYNALSTMVPVLKRIPPEVWDNVEEVVVFDDASQDATFEVAVGLKAVCDLPKLCVLKHATNLGYGGNQKAGYAYFIDRGFDVVVLLHGDGQYAPEILSHMYAPIVRGEAHAVFGSRMMTTYGGALKGGMPLYKYVGNRILTFFENRALGLRLTEFHSGYRAYDLHALRAIDFSRMTNDFHFDTEIIIKLHHQRFVIREVPIPTYYGSEICYVNGFRYARDVMRAIRRYRQTCRSVTSAPEFAEYFVRYPVKRMPHSSHESVQRLIGANQDVLDVGSGEGFFAELLQANGNRVTGIDYVPQVTRREAFHEYHSADLEQEIDRVLDTLGTNRFDFVLLLDVLEHLKKPDLLLRQCEKSVNKTGRLVVSLPNVANVTVRMALFFGRFPYADRGILDRTHLRFYTLTTARRLLEDNGWRILTEKATVMPVELALGVSPDNVLMRGVSFVLAAATRLWPRLLGYQFVFSAVPAARGTDARLDRVSDP